MEGVDVEMPLVMIRVGTRENGYFVGPFDPEDAALWREENVTHPGQSWAIVPLLPPEARPVSSDVPVPAEMGSELERLRAVAEMARKYITRSASEIDLYTAVRAWWDNRTAGR